jgi:hypothetical protein
MDLDKRLQSMLKCGRKVPNSSLILWENKEPVSNARFLQHSDEVIELLLPWVTLEDVAKVREEPWK